MSESRRRFRDELAEVTRSCGDRASDIAANLRDPAEWGASDDALVATLRAASEATLRATAATGGDR